MNKEEYCIFRCTSDQKKAIRMMSEEYGKSISEIIRMALDQFLGVDEL